MPSRSTERRSRAEPILLDVSGRPGALALLALATLTLFPACGPGGGNREADAAPDAESRKAPASVRQQRLPPRGEAWVIFGSDTVRAEVAETEEAREEGLMYRRNVPDGTGMLFVFEDEAVRSFWMRNTYVPLSVAFLDSSMRILNIEQMEPETEEYHDSEGPAMFALEVPRGWFEEHGIAAGEEAEIVFGPR